jgi:hypothetical protein
MDEAKATIIELEGHFIIACDFILNHEFQLPMVKAVKKILVSKYEPQHASYQVPRDE